MKVIITNMPKDGIIPYNEKTKTAYEMLYRAGIRHLEREREKERKKRQEG